jgi:diguanylate cyclase (GGDEF)-like protein/PAS domain S-box-containing protein
MEMDGALIHVRYDHGLVAVSIVLAVFASYAALDLAGRVSSAGGRTRAMWLACGATAMGLGIWAMHYVAMLALTMPMEVFYHLPSVMISLFAAIVASAAALFLVSRPTMGFWQQVTGAVAMGSGIAEMHYIGMAAMRSTYSIGYDKKIVALSIGLAVSVSFVAMKLAFLARDENRMTQRKIISALTMGSAIASMHYTGMWAAKFHNTGVAPDLSHAISLSTVGVMAISATCLFVQGGAIASSVFDRFIAVQKNDLNTARERELYFHTLAETVPEIIWAADPNGQDDYFNQQCFEYTGMTLEELRGTGWRVIIHADDLEECFSKWQIALRTGEPYDVEYRICGRDGKYRWFLGRANPIRNAAGEIVKWFGTCTDIENQKQHQQNLEGQIQERTLQLAELNTRLQEEMFEKDFARNELDYQHERMMRDLEKRSERATMLAKLGELLQNCMSRDEVFAAALGYAPRIFSSSRGALAFLNAGRTFSEVVGSWNDCQLSAMEFGATDCWALRTGQSHLVTAGDSTAHCAHASGLRNTYLCIPVLAQGETMGVVHFQSTEEVPQFDPSELSFKTTFAGQVGLSIANIRLKGALRTQSVRDSLTGLYNRRYMEEALDREVRRASRAKKSVGILMIDLDHFKQFNDAYGHDAGDTVLREVARFLVKNVRAEDFVCRYGGEEFLIILPTADVDGARTKADRLRTMMKELRIVYQGQKLSMVTLSIGVAEFPRHGTSPTELMAAADAALYEAKKSGRDRVVVSNVPAQTREESKSASNSA